MFGLSIFILAVAKLIQNPDQVLRVNLFWFILTTALTAPQYLNFGGGAYGSPLGIVIGIAGFFATIIGTVVVAIGWHRFVILDERQTDWLIFGGGWPLSRYFWISLVPALLAFMIVAPIFYSFVEPLGDNNFQTIMIFFVATTVFWIIVLLLSLVLPAIAIGAHLSFAQSLKATLPRIGSVLVISLLLSAIMVFPDFLLEAVFGDWMIEGISVGSLIGYIISSAIYWLATLISVGVLSELYRALAASVQSENA